MNFVILFLFSTIVFIVNSESTEDNSHTISEKNVGNLKGRNGDTNDNGEKSYENKNERVRDHSVSNSNGKKYHDEDKSVDTYAKEIRAEIEEMPKEDQLVAYKIHMIWYVKATRMETKLKHELAIERKKNIKTVILPILRAEVEDYERKYLPSTNLDKSSMIREVKKKDPEFAVPESMFKADELSLHYVRWQYILLFSTHPDIAELQKFLAKHYPTINNEAIAKALAMFYEKASDKIHGAMADLTEAEIEEGLIANGLQDRDMITVIKALLFIPKGRKDELPIQSQ